MRRRLVIAVAAGLAMTLVVFLILIKPKMNQISKVNATIAEAERREQDLRIQLRELEQAEKDAPAIQAKLAQLELLLPPTPDLPTFIRQIQAAANADGVDLQSIAPSPPSPYTSPGAPSASTGIETVNVTIQASGGFFRMESFLARIEDLQRVVEVRSLGLTPNLNPVTGERTLQSTITLVMYVVQRGARAPSTGIERPAVTSASPSPTASSGPGTSR